MGGLEARPLDPGGLSEALPTACFSLIPYKARATADSKPFGVFPPPSPLFPCISKSLSCLAGISPVSLASLFSSHIGKVPPGTRLQCAGPAGQALVKGLGPIIPQPHLGLVDWRGCHRPSGTAPWTHVIGVNSVNIFPVFSPLE